MPKYSWEPIVGNWPTIFPFGTWTAVTKKAVGRSTTSPSICFAFSAATPASSVS